LTTPLGAEARHHAIKAALRSVVKLAGTLGTFLRRLTMRGDYISSR
jgi:hypothetical protein